MFIYMHYDGPEPAWATSLRGIVPAFSPAFHFGPQEETLGPILADKSPCGVAGAFKDVFQLDGALWSPLSEAREILLVPDQQATTDHLVWRDQWLLLRADAVVTDVGASLEIPLFAAMLRIPVVGVSFTSFGMNPWMAKSAQLTVNSPAGGEQILSAMGVQILDEEPPEEEDDLPDMPVDEEVIS